MGILNDELIDVKANLCWNHQQEQLLDKVKIDCICGQLAEMIYMTRQNIAEEIERELCDIENHGNFHEDWTHEVNTTALKLAANIARGQRNTAIQGVRAALSDIATDETGTDETS